MRVAERPLKFVTNFCYSPNGSEKFAHVTRGWLELNPRRGIISDDKVAMYQNVSRPAMFAFIRAQFPELLPVYRFFYYTPPVIWLGGARVPISPGRTLRAPLTCASSAPATPISTPTRALGSTAVSTPPTTLASRRTTDCPTSPTSSTVPRPR